jgi:diguanylate cyclase (GGDEF)-like protein
MAKMADSKARTLNTYPSVVPAGQPKSAFMLVLTGMGFGELYKLPPGRAVRIGRGEEADIRLDDEGVSRIHCSLEARGSEALLRDLGSQNGTYVEGERTAERVLVDGDRVQIGSGTAFKVAIADELEANYQRRLVEVALRDPLTGLYNRRHFGERLVAEFAAARRYRHSVSIGMLDVDRLKEVNVLFGRQAGDEVLRSVAFVLQSLVREADVVARIGGDEFAFLLRETELKGALTLAERLRHSVEQMRTRIDGTEIGVTATVGIAGYTREYARDDDQPSDLSARAQSALERAKLFGMNRVAN